MDVSIRRVNAADASNMLVYLKQIGSESDNLLFGAEGLPYTVEEESVILDRYAVSDKAVMLIALDGDMIVGNGVFTGFSRQRIAHRGEIAMSVRKDYWGQGIGSALMERLILFAKQAGCAIISLEVRADNERAIHLYEKFGFQRYGLFSRFFCIDGQYWDAVCMSLQL